MLSEATKDLFWASGLPPKDTASTPVSQWGGSNTLGKLLMDLRSTHQGKDQAIAPTPGVSQSEIVQMASELIDHAMTPSLPYTSPELIQRADTILASISESPGASSQEQQVNSQAATTPASLRSKLLGKFKASSSKNSKRKAKSPINDDHDDKKRNLKLKDNDQNIYYDLRTYFTSPKPTFSLRETGGVVHMEGTHGFDLVFLSMDFEIRTSILHIVNWYDFSYCILWKHSINYIYY